MAAVVSRIAYTNRIAGGGVALVATSQLNSLPVTFLRDQLPSKAWQSFPGWTVDAQLNRLDWNRGGVRTCTINSGLYGTGAEVATECQARMQAADAGATYTVSYNASTHVFTLGANLAFTLLNGSGANAAVSIAESLGYTASDTGSSVSHVAPNAAYQSVHFLKADLGSALTTALGAIHSHNLLAGATVRHQANATDAWTSPTVNQVLTGTSGIRAAFYTEETLRYRRLKVNDVSNPLGYSRLKWWDGPYVQPSVTFSDAFVNDPEELSVLGVAIGGAHFVDERPIRDVFNIEYREVGDADLALLAGMEEATPKGKNFLFFFDPLNDVADAVYGFRAAPMRQAYVPGVYWNVSFPLAEALE